MPIVLFLSTSSSSLIPDLNCYNCEHHWPSNWFRAGDINSIGWFTFEHCWKWSSDFVMPTSFEWKLGRRRFREYVGNAIHWLLKFILPSGFIYVSTKSHRIRLFLGFWLLKQKYCLSLLGMLPALFEGIAFVIWWSFIDKNFPCLIFLVFVLYGANEVRNCFFSLVFVSALHLFWMTW